MENNYTQEQFGFQFEIQTDETISNHHFEFNDIVSDVTHFYLELRLKTFGLERKLHNIK